MYVLDLFEVMMRGRNGREGWRGEGGSIITYLVMLNVKGKVNGDVELYCQYPHPIPIL